jgi:hypothetical protein
MYLALARPKRGIFLRKMEDWRRIVRLGWNWVCLDLVSLTKDFSGGGKNDFAFLTARDCQRVRLRLLQRRRRAILHSTRKSNVEGQGCLCLL